MNLGQDLLDVLYRHSQENNDYENPNFLQVVNDAIDAYYNLENDEVDAWISNMWSR